MPPLKYKKSNIMEQETELRECPFCKESIKYGAIKCKHCNSKLAPLKLSREGICSYCKEEIHKDAIKCKHCKSSLENNSKCGCGNIDKSNSSTSLNRGVLEPF